MNLTRLGGKNAVIISTDSFDVLVSYSTPVACVGVHGRAHKTEKKWSNTTSKHISQFFKERGFEPHEVETQPQEWFDKLLIVEEGHDES